VLNRYNKALLQDIRKNFQFKEGAIASSVAHDSHNIIAVGCDDESIAKQSILLLLRKEALVA